MNNEKIIEIFAELTAKVLSDPIILAEIDFCEKNGIKWEFEIRKTKENE